MKCLLATGEESESLLPQTCRRGWSPSACFCACACGVCACCSCGGPWQRCVLRHPHAQQLHFGEFQSCGGFLHTGRNNKFKFPAACRSATRRTKQRPRPTTHDPQPPSQHPPVHFRWREPKPPLLLPRSPTRSRTDRTKQSLLKSAGENQAAMVHMPATMPTIDQGEASQKKRTRAPSEHKVGVAFHLKSWVQKLCMGGCACPACVVMLV